VCCPVQLRCDFAVIAHELNAMTGIDGAGTEITLLQPLTPAQHSTARQHKHKRRQQQLVAYGRTDKMRKVE
jgi:hypothetical protein